MPGFTNEMVQDLINAGLIPGFLKDTKVGDTVVYESGDNIQTVTIKRLEIGTNGTDDKNDRIFYMLGTTGDGPLRHFAMGENTGCYYKRGIDNSTQGR